MTRRLISARAARRRSGLLGRDENERLLATEFGDAETRIDAALSELDARAARLVRARAGLDVGTPRPQRATRLGWIDHHYAWMAEREAELHPSGGRWRRGAAALRWLRSPAAVWRHVAEERRDGESLALEALRHLEHVDLFQDDPPVMYMVDNIARVSVLGHHDPRDRALSVAVHGNVHRGQARLRNLMRAYREAVMAFMRDPGPHTRERVDAVLALLEGQARHYEFDLVTGEPDPGHRAGDADSSKDSQYVYGTPFIAAAKSVLGGAAPLNAALDHPDTSLLPQLPEIKGCDPRPWRERLAAAPAAGTTPPGGDPRHRGGPPRSLT